jgi:hypothetical protein
VLIHEVHTWYLGIISEEHWLCACFLIEVEQFVVPCQKEWFPEICDTHAMVNSMAQELFNRPLTSGPILFKLLLIRMRKVQRTDVKYSSLPRLKNVS